MLFPPLWRVSAALAAVACVAGAQELPDQEFTDSPAEVQVTSVPDDLPGSWLTSLWRAPFLWLVPAVADLSLLPPPPPPAPPCLSDPLAELQDDAFAYEAQVGTSSVVDIDGLLPGASRALSRFELVVRSAGGRMVLTSAYRPAAYQAHLQDVWDKWMLEMRNNHAPQCAELRAEVASEFERHELLESQRPVSFSDHTRGIGVDAAVLLPRGARLGRKRVGIDTLARVVGFRRPDILRDPVHFRYVAGS